MTRNDIIERFRKNETANQVGFNESNSMFINACLDEWTKPHRFYHGFSHLCRLMEEIGGLSSIVWNVRDKEMMEILALTHDVVCDPNRKNNEEASIEFIKKFPDFIANAQDDMQEIFDGIRETQYKSDNDFRNIDKVYLRLFCKMDIGIPCMDTEGDTLTNVAHREIQLLKEFQLWDFPTYKSKRIAFIDRFKYFSGAFKEQAKNFLSHYRPKIGVYPGSFNPLHIGHMNIIEQAEKIFDKVIIAVGKNPEKVEDGKPWPGKVLPFHEVVSYHSLLSDYLKTLDYADVTVIRGLRSGYDLDYEMTQLRVLEDCGCKLPVAYFLCSKETTHVSSSMIRGLSKFNNSNVEQYIPKKYSYAK